MRRHPSTHRILWTRFKDTTVRQ